MPKNVRTFELPALTDAVEFNIQEVSTLWGHALGAKFYYEPEASWFVSDVPYRFYNWVTKTEITANTPRERTGAIFNRLKTYQKPILWIVDSASSDDFIEYIKSHGWKGGPMAIWAHDLHTLGEKPANPEGVTIERVDNAESLRQWMHVFATGYDGLPDYLYDHAIKSFQRYGFVNPPGIHYYLGRLNGEPVCTTLLFLGGGIAGVYCVATLPSARRRGIASAVVRESLFDARDLGYHIAALQASDMGVSVYRRLGFEEHGAINFYILPGASQK